MAKLNYQQWSGTNSLVPPQRLLVNHSFAVGERYSTFIEKKAEKKDEIDNKKLDSVQLLTKPNRQVDGGPRSTIMASLTSNSDKPNNAITTGSMSDNVGASTIITTGKSSTVSVPTNSNGSVTHSLTTSSSGWETGRMSMWDNNNEVSNNGTKQNSMVSLWTRFVGAHTTATTLRMGASKRRRSSRTSSNFPISIAGSSPPSSSLSTTLNLANFSPVPIPNDSGIVRDKMEVKMGMSGDGFEREGGSEYVIPSVLATEDDGTTVAVSRRLLDIHQISSRLHRSFPWEGLGLDNNNSTTGSIGRIFTSRIGFDPASTPHTILFSSLYVVPLILLFGVAVAIIWLVCACFYYTMQRIKIALCPSRRRRTGNEDEGNNGRDPGPKKGNKNVSAASNTDSLFNDDNKKPQVLTPEILEMRRQERLAFLHAECANLEQQLTGLRASLPLQLQSSFEEKKETLTSHASDSDLEYLGATESPPLKRNSISLQDIPQSVIRIRREKELRQIKEEIEYLKSIAQQEKEKTARVAKGLKGSMLITQDFELPPSKPGSPNDTKVEPLSQHISHLKTQRKLTEIRTELEDLAMQLLHADEIKAKRSSLQDLPRTAMNIKREQNIISMTNEISKMQNYKLQKRNLLETALEKTSQGGGNEENNGKKAGSKSFIPNTSETPSTVQDAAAKYSDPEFVHRSSIRRQREQELNRVRVELKDLAYKLNLNPMNYISEDRVRLVPSQSMQSTVSATGHNRSVSSALNHV